MTFVLVEVLGSDKAGETLWFKQMTAISPMTTPNINERAVFETEDEAKQCPAVFHALSDFKIVKLTSEPDSEPFRFDK